MTCELCVETGGTLLWRDERCRVVLVPEPGYPGYCRVIWNAHVREMTDLGEHERAAIMRVVFGVERVLRDLFAPEKVNLASFGNLTPHLHWHVIARFRDDPHFPGTVWGARQRDLHPPSAGAHAEQIGAALARRLG
ncbi:MAG: HIT family protein [Betaproteobacteria bacterium]|nr:HIT family protein [Betaproteobacteria bacterium]